MTDEQINAAIDRIKGHDKHECQCDCCHPDWCNDLNAMHEAEKTLTNANMYVIEYHIKAMVKGHGFYFHATARERAEAFLRTLGKWEPTTEESSVDQKEVQG
jgi:hypothetical protein